jgi:signal-transduction protein with cAMP-binding, CBS, and nucleotidyltransferase domain
MTEQPIFLRANDDLKYCAEMMADNHVSTVIVKENERVIGILAEQDIVRKVVAKGINPLEKKVKEVMETKLTTISPEKDIFEALMKMKDLNIRHLPVVDGENLIGLLTLKDILKIEPQLFELLVEKFELREQERKPTHEKPNADVCQTCGKITDKLFSSNGTMVCAECKEQKK